MPLVQWAWPVHLAQGVICSRRHVHMTPTDAADHGVNDGDTVPGCIGAHGRGLTLIDVLVRVRSNYVLKMPIDTDEANAAGLQIGDVAVLQASTLASYPTTDTPRI